MSEFKQLQIPEELEKRMEKLNWVDWPKMAIKSISEKVEDIEEFELERSSAGIFSGNKQKDLKIEISKRYAKTHELSDKDWEFCEKIDWHPVDELPPKPEHIEELKKALKETPIGYKDSMKFLESLK